MIFDPYNRSLKIWESIGSLTPKMGTHLRVWGFIPSHSPPLLGAWDVTPRLPSWPTPLQALALIMSPRLNLWQSLWYAHVLFIAFVFSQYSSTVQYCNHFLWFSFTNKHHHGIFKWSCIAHHCHVIPCYSSSCGLL